MTKFFWYEAWGINRDSIWDWGQKHHHLESSIYDMAVISVVPGSIILVTVRVILLPFNIEKIGLPAQ